MSQRRTKKRLSKGQMENLKAMGDQTGPLDWIRTDDDSICDCLFIQMLTRGTYNFLDRLEEVLRKKAEWSRAQVRILVEAQEILEQYPIDPHRGEPALLDAAFYDDALSHLRQMIEELHRKWDGLPEEFAPPLATQRHDAAVIGAMYPIPGPGVYIPKPSSVRPPRARAKTATE